MSMGHNRDGTSDNGTSSGHVARRQTYQAIRLSEPRSNPLQNLSGTYQMEPEAKVGYTARRPLSFYTVVLMPLSEITS